MSKLMFTGRVVIVTGASGGKKMKVLVKIFVI